MMRLLLHHLRMGDSGDLHHSRGRHPDDRVSELLGQDLRKIVGAFWHSQEVRSSIDICWSSPLYAITWTLLPGPRALPDEVDSSEGNRR